MDTYAIRDGLHRNSNGDYMRIGEFRVHSWGDSAVGAIGNHATEHEEWEANFQLLLGHFNVTRSPLPSSWMDQTVHRRKGTAPPPKGTQLRAWVDNQRQLYRHGELDVKRQQRLQDTGLQLTLKGKLREVDWETMVGRLKSFHMANGHCRVQEQEGEELLEQWVQVQQMKEMRGTLSHEKQSMLNSLGMSWKTTWLESWKQLCLLKQHHGKVRVVALKNCKRTVALYIWIRNQRMMQMEGSLDKERVVMLDKLGCRWSGLEHGDTGALFGSSSLDRYIVWEPRFNCLMLFKQMHGHCDVQSLLMAHTDIAHTDIIIGLHPTPLPLDTRPLPPRPRDTQCGRAGCGVCPFAGARRGERQARRGERQARRGERQARRGERQARRGERQARRNHANIACLHPLYFSKKDSPMGGEGHER